MNSKRDALLSKREFTRADIIELLKLERPEDIEALHHKAYEIKLKHVGNTVFFRGLIELSNICIKNCFYCGIRKGNKSVERYIMPEEEVLEAAKWSYESGYGSIVLQSGERRDNEFTCYIENLIEKIKEVSDGRLGITLSLGEQSEETYRRWYAAGAHRYLLRIETSNKKLYEKLHPEDHDWEERDRCIDTMQKLGYQVGTGVMIGLPGQTFEDLADDILYFKKKDVAMIGMGPFIPHHDTPMADSMGQFNELKEKQLELGLKMIAVTRIVLKDVNIASTTALQALKDVGREMGLLAGANIIMPNLTETRYRVDYQLYDGKPCLDENMVMCAGCLARRIEAIGETIGYNQWGDSPHFLKAKSL